MEQFVPKLFDCMKSYSKEQFVKALKELQQVDEFTAEVNEVVRKHRDDICTDFINGDGLGIAHKDLVIELLDKIMGSQNKDVDYWVYELEYGKKYFEGCVLQDDKPVDISSAVKLYDYMVSRYED